MNPGESKAPETLAERFWSLARGMEGSTDSTEPVAVVEHVLAVLDALAAGAIGRDLTANTVNFLTLLRQHEVKGDMLYASPEQARGEQVDERSLVFSVGVLLFEKLTGRHPFGADGNPQRLARIRRGEMASGVNYFPRVPTQLRVVLVKAMGPFPEERWNSLVELRAELEIFLTRMRNPGNGGATPSRTRPPPALPGDRPPSERATQRRAATASPSPVAPSVDLSRMATMSGRLSAVKAESEPGPVPMPIAGAAASMASASAAHAPGARRRRLPPGAWAFGGVLVGVLVTSGVFLAAWPRGRAATGARTTASASAAVPSPAAPSPAAPAVPVRAAARSPAIAATAAPAIAATAATAATAAPPAAPTRGAFDPDTGGQTALAAVRTCIAGDRRARFGASLRYDVHTGRSSRVYFGAVEELQPGERSCLEQKLLDLDAGGPPAGASIVTYSFHLTPTGDQVKAHLHPPE